MSRDRPLQQVGLVVSLLPLFPSLARCLSPSLSPSSGSAVPSYTLTHTHTHAHTLPSLLTPLSCSLSQPFPSWERVSQLDGRPADLREPLWGVTMATVADEDRESPAGPHGCHGTGSGYGGGRCQRPHLPTPSPKPGKATACECVCVRVGRELAG